MAKKPVALLFHQGGFVHGGDDQMRQQRKVARRRGFKPVRVDYTLGDLGAAVRDAKRSADKYGPRRKVVAYGESAGGALAALLASRGKVDAAVTYSGPNNLAKWFGGRGDQLGSSRAQQRRWSASSRKSRSPILAYTTEVDPWVDPTPTRRWARRDPNVRHRKVGGLHIAGDGYRSNLARAMRYLDRRV